MERRKRVRQILESKAFREELENLIVSERQQGHNVESLRTLEKLSELISPISHLQLSSVFSSFSNRVLVALWLKRASTKGFVEQRGRPYRSPTCAARRLPSTACWSGCAATSWLRCTG